MRRQPLARSKKQYVHWLNSPALRIVREAPGARGVPLPACIEPLPAADRPKPPASGEWLHEIKFDGNRPQVHKREGVIHCFTRRATAAISIARPAISNWKGSSAGARTAAIAPVATTLGSR
jgi:ATP-dependent DNA ligase